MKPDVAHILEEHGIQPTAQRAAIAKYVLHSTEHPSADKVWTGIQESFPKICLATIYNTLNLFVEKGLLREVYLAPDSVLFNSNTNRHYHFIDDDTGRSYEIPWNQVEVSSEKTLPDFEVNDYQVVMCGQCHHARR